ncbi:MAG: hypothetical protein COA90_10850 [Gammaproteobacteria bacterium]|nr:MAG: hypothetical protein COA90_10850 [Gammaproteobacteria bacterium]
MNIQRILLLVLALFISNANAAESELNELVEKTRKLNGTTISYEYTSGKAYNVKFEEAGVSYRYLTGSKPALWWGPFPYQAFEVEDNVFMAAWFEQGYGDYVTLLVNLNNNLLYGSAILRGEDVHFHGAKINTISRSKHAE